jgi:hypothetical protein
VAPNYPSKTSFSVKVRNTFFEIKLDISQATTAFPRSSSVPRAFKPCGSSECKWEDDGSSSTTDGGIPESCRTVLTDIDYQDSLKDWEESPSQQSSECGRWADCNESDEDSDKGKVTLSLADMVEQSDMKAQGRSKLRSRAQAFQSLVVEPPDEVKLMISQTVETVRTGEDVCNVCVQDGCMGGTAILTAMMICQSCNASPDTASVISAAKQSLLSAAAESENSYIMGYDLQPFTDIDACSFSATIGCVPPAHRNTACWDTYMYGFCPRAGSCRWDHPSEMDIMRCIFTVADGQAISTPTVEETNQEENKTPQKPSWADTTDEDEEAMQDDLLQTIQRMKGLKFQRKEEAQSESRNAAVW